MNLSSYYSGRLNRAKYIGFSFLVFGISFGVSYFLQKASLSNVATLASLVATVVGSTFVVKRFHDIEHPGWHYWLLFVPFYNIYLGLILLFKKGTVGSNAYGVDPLAAVPVETPPVTPVQ